MYILYRPDTNTYLSDDKPWTNDVQNAMVFDSADEAMNVARKILSAYKTNKRPDIYIAHLQPIHTYCPSCES